MTSKTSSRKFSFLLAASLLTAAFPETTQANCDNCGFCKTFECSKGVLIGAAGIAAGVITGFYIFLLPYDLYTVPIINSKDVAAAFLGFVATSIIISATGATSIFCLKRAYKKLFGEQKEKSKEKERLDTITEKKSVCVKYKLAKANARLEDGFFYELNLEEIIIEKTSPA